MLLEIPSYASWMESARARGAGEGIGGGQSAPPPSPPPCRVWATNTWPRGPPGLPPTRCRRVARRGSTKENSHAPRPWRRRPPRTACSRTRLRKGVGGREAECGRGVSVAVGAAGPEAPLTEARRAAAGRRAAVGARRRKRHLGVRVDDDLHGRERGRGRVNANALRPRAPPILRLRGLRGARSRRAARQRYAAGAPPEPRPESSARAVSKRTVVILHAQKSRVEDSVLRRRSGRKTKQARGLAESGLGTRGRAQTHGRSGGGSGRTYGCGSGGGGGSAGAGTGAGHACVSSAALRACGGACAGPYEGAVVT
jgi:hypothetical protein